LFILLLNVIRHGGAKADSSIKLMIESSTPIAKSQLLAATVCFTTLIIFYKQAVLLLHVCLRYLIFIPP
jgi:hypothetical protein